MVQSIQIGKCDMAHQQNRGPNVSRHRISQSFQIEAEKTFDKQTSLQNEVLTNQVQKDHTSAWGYAWQTQSQHCTKRETLKQSLLQSGRRQGVSSHAGSPNMHVQSTESQQRCQKNCMPTFRSFKLDLYLYKNQLRTGQRLNIRPWY